MYQLALLILFLGFSACVSPPKIRPCELDFINQVGYCTHVFTKEKTIVPMSEMQGWSATSPGDTLTLWDWVKRRMLSQ